MATLDPGCSQDLVLLKRIHKLSELLAEEV